MYREKKGWKNAHRIDNNGYLWEIKQEREVSTKPSFDRQCCIFEVGVFV